MAVVQKSYHARMLSTEKINELTSKTHLVSVHYKDGITKITFMSNGDELTVGPACEETARQQLDAIADSARDRLVRKLLREQEEST